MYTDSPKLFDVLTTGTRTDEKGLMIDIIAGRQSYKRYDICGIGHTKGINSSADGLLKVKHNGVLEGVSRTGTIDKRAGTGPIKN